MVGQWSISYLPLKIRDPVPSDITIARSQTPKKVVDLANEIGLLPNEVGSQKLCSISKYVYISFLISSNLMVHSRLRFLCQCLRGSKTMPVESRFLLVRDQIFVSELEIKVLDIRYLPCMLPKCLSIAGFLWT